jgi:hypothetical protein
LLFVGQKRAVRGSFVQFSAAASEREPQLALELLKVGELVMHMD